MPDSPQTLLVNTENEIETARLGNDLSLILRPGDLIALSGELGSGKSFLARSIIQSLAQDDGLEVPSPTYTICQEYQTTPPIQHYDLYRLSELDELDELGWQEALETGISIMEWPEQVFDPLPVEALQINISDLGDTAREFKFSGNPEIVARVRHTIELRDFIEDSPLKGARRIAFAADASARRYERLAHQDHVHYLMDAPKAADGPPIKDDLSYSKIAHLAEDVSAFVAIDKVLRDAGLCAPKIFKYDLNRGLLLIENIGHGLIIDETRKPIPERYLASIEFLALMHEKQFTTELQLSNDVNYVIPAYDKGVILAEVDLLLEWFAPEFANAPITQAQKDEFKTIWSALCSKLSRSEQTLVLRDFHSPNIIWRDDAVGVDRIGVIDFQDALIGPSAYDVASLAQDARVDVDEELEQKLLNHYLTLRRKNNANFDATQFAEAYAIMAAQRATKVLGIFVRLNNRDNKPEYMAHLPRLKDYLSRSLRHPVLSEYKAWLETVINL